MKYTILMGSSRRDGNTAALLRSFMEENSEMGVEQDLIWLKDLDIHSCQGCKACQENLDEFGCVQRDDCQIIFDSIATSDVLVLATPIYSWFATAPMKAVMDRLIYGGCKYYGSQRGGSLLRMTQVATLVTCGYPSDEGADLWDEALQRWCKHGEMDYLGILCRQDEGPGVPFMDEEKDIAAREFAHTLFITAGMSY